MYCKVVYPITLGLLAHGTGFDLFDDSSMTNGGDSTMTNKNCFLTSADKIKKLVDIFYENIMYEDSKRVIECGSGMEKMMTSIAIRVALINITNLSKPDFFIIDEGFGALDETNIEACSRLLQSLKNYFKSIIIISHVDAIKDVVDDILKIESRGKDLYVRY